MNKGTDNHLTSPSLSDVVEILGIWFPKMILMQVC